RAGRTSSASSAAGGHLRALHDRATTACSLTTRPPWDTETEQSGKLELVENWGGRTRTSNFPVNSRAVCQLTYTPLHRNHPSHRQQPLETRRTDAQQRTDAQR